jgi:hypothetical protein
VLLFNGAPRQEGVMGLKVQFHSFLDLGTDGGEWSASRSGHFIPRERVPGIHWIGGWVGSRAGLDVVMKRNILSPCRESNPRTPIVQPVPSRYTDWVITALVILYYIILYYIILYYPLIYTSVSPVNFSLPSLVFRIRPSPTPLLCLPF